jgi:hypothetical protein
VACHSSCKTCSASLNTNCLTCNSPYFFLDEDLHTCVDTCPNGEYEDAVSGKCETCKGTCKTCSSPDTCTTCEPPLKLQQHQCVSQCDPNFYFYSDPLNNNKQHCFPCDSNCKKCEFESTKCTECFNEQYLGIDQVCHKESCLVG